jgi:hypothetical protein
MANASGSYQAFDVKTYQLIPLVVGFAGRTATVHTTTHWTAGGCMFLSHAVAQ